VLQIKKLEARYLSAYSVQVTWQFHPSPDPISNYAAQVYCGHSQDVAQMEPVSGLLIGPTAFIHTLLDIRNDYHRYSYRIKYYPLATPAQITWSDAFVVEHPPDLITAELINKQELVLRVKNGKPCALRIRMITGLRCPRCWDEVTLARVDGDCHVCVGTGFMGGYYPPVYKYVNINSDIKQFQDQGDGGKTDDIQAVALLGPHPPLSPRDIIIEQNSGVVWVAIREMTNVRKYRYPTKQVWGISRESDQSIEYKTLTYGGE